VHLFPVARALSVRQAKRGTKKKQRKKGDKRNESRIRGLTFGAVTATRDVERPPEVHPLLPMVSVISRFGAARRRLRDVRAVTCMAYHPLRS
jgi:hypothetical protein